MNKRQQKNIYVAAFKYEANLCDGLDKICDILGIDCLCRWDNALDWVEDESHTEDDIKAVLAKMGYKIV